MITGAANTRQVKTICDEVAKRLKELTGSGPLHIEGLSDASWVLLDFGDVVVHVFLDETREYFDLERLWSDAPRIDWGEEPDSIAVAGSQS